MRRKIGFGWMDSSLSSPAGIAREGGRERPYDPRVHPLRKKMDCRVKPGNDAELDQSLIINQQFTEETQ
jgi:hypothetical protein